MSNTTDDAPSWRARPDIAYKTVWTAETADDLGIGIELRDDGSYYWEIWCLRSRNVRCRPLKETACS